MTQMLGPSRAALEHWDAQQRIKSVIAARLRAREYEVTTWTPSEDFILALGRVDTPDVTGLRYMGQMVFGVKGDRTVGIIAHLVRGVGPAIDERQLLGVQQIAGLNMQMYWAYPIGNEKQRNCEYRVISLEEVQRIIEWYPGTRGTRYLSVDWERLHPFDEVFV